ncbi:MAG: class II fumarate hydratase, partial [Rhodocyclaceae bacterium]|nr:class II fumarate hydratase [Rhodocyclaceae bacterium]
MARTEHDSLGRVDVPDDALWGAQTERARHHFHIGDGCMPMAVIHALGLVKAAAAEVNGRLGLIPAERAEAIGAAALEVAGGTLDAHFPLPVW